MTHKRTRHAITPRTRMWRIFGYHFFPTTKCRHLYWMLILLVDNQLLFQTFLNTNFLYFLNQQQQQLHHHHHHLILLANRFACVWCLVVGPVRTETIKSLVCPTARRSLFNCQHKEVFDLKLSLSQCAKCACTERFRSTILSCSYPVNQPTSQLCISSASLCVSLSGM